MDWPFVPDRSGYSVQQLDKMRTVPTSGGFPRERRDLIDSTVLVSCQFTFAKKEKFDEFQTLWAAYKKAPQWFNIMLVTDMLDPNVKLTNHKAQVVTGSYSLNEFKGRKWVVAMQLEAYQDGNT